MKGCLYRYLQLSKILQQHISSSTLCRKSPRNLSRCIVQSKKKTPRGPPSNRPRRRLNIKSSRARLDTHALGFRDFSPFKISALKDAIVSYTPRFILPTYIVRVLNAYTQKLYTHFDIRHSECLTYPKFLPFRMSL